MKTESKRLVDEMFPLPDMKHRFAEVQGSYAARGK